MRSVGVVRCQYPRDLLLQLLLIQLQLVLRLQHLLWLKKTNHEEIHTQTYIPMTYVHTLSVIHVQAYVYMNTYVHRYVQYVLVFWFGKRSEEKCAHMSTGEQVTDVCMGNGIHTHTYIHTYVVHHTGFIVKVNCLTARKEISNTFYGTCYFILNHLYVRALYKSMPGYNYSICTYKRAC